jgi:succinyl-diaminopimelate desuccinylase
VEVVEAAILAQTGKMPQRSTSGGTSDGRFIAPYCQQILELGVCNDTIHHVNERVLTQQIQGRSELYEQILTKLLV